MRKTTQADAIRGPRYKTPPSNLRHICECLGWQVVWTQNGNAKLLDETRLPIGEMPADMWLNKMKRSLVYSGEST